MGEKLAAVAVLGDRVNKVKQTATRTNDWLL